MTSKDVKNYIETEGMDKLYKKFEKYFAEVDTWSERFAGGDLLNEYELSHALDRLTGVYMRFHIIASAIDSYKTNKELAFIEKAFKEAEKKPVVAQIKESARASTKELRTYRGDFLNYSANAEKAIGTCQSRMKRLTVEKGAKGVDFTGDVNNVPNDNSTAKPVIENGWAT